ncbi:MAG: response regulator [Bacteroidales bacterium]|nr:response regulator [Bacteroidales bacterium]
MQNLLSNAIKFTAPGGEIYLSTRIDRRNFVLHVSDTGIGFTPEQKEHIFKPFYQASNDTRNIGTGIGLSIVSLTVEKMKGTIEVHSAPGEGSVFTVTLPLAAKGEVIAEYEPDPLPDALPLPEADAAMAEPPADDGNAETDGTHVLIVEDTPEVAHYIKRQFPAAVGYRFHFAADGEEALVKARQLVPDLIITDVMMPRMDGFQLCRRVRADELVCHVPVIMVTARATHEDRLQGLQAGADAYLEKPFHSDELTLRAAKLLEQRELLRRKYSEAVAGGGDPQSAVLREGDKAFVEKVTDAVHAAISNGKGKIDYDALAYTLCLSRAQLNRKVKAVTGYTTTDFILQIRISMAKQYLDRSNLTIWEIALRCGMDSDSYFCTLFKKCTGMTPLQYKNREK